jgi:triacylglycerol lipase
MRIVLVHGVLGFGMLGPLDYFNGVKNHLRSAFGAEVLTAAVPPIGSIASRGAELGRQILHEFAGGEQVHILAHSMGGLDARWALRNVPGLSTRVKTLVAIGTPHHGSPVADAIQAGTIPALPLPAEAMVLELRINQAALHDLTTTSAKAFDKATPDVPGVDYLHVVGDTSLPGAQCSVTFRAIQKAFKLPPPNDGAVTVHSATRGGTRQADLTLPVDHAGEIGWNLDHPIPAFPALIASPHLRHYDDIMRLL